MSVASRILSALSAVGPPCEQTTYTGTADSWITFNLASAPDYYVDNDARYERYLIQVHLIAPLPQNLTALTGQIKDALYAAGFGRATMQDASDPVADRKRHLVFECEALEAIT
jgi:hypothetical protein